MKRRGQGRGRERFRGSGCGKVAPAVNEVPIENVSVDENRSAHNENIEEEVEEVE